MEILFVLIPLGVTLVAIAAGVLIWAVKSGQYDDLESIGRRMPDDEP
ncbi:cbb3-type cytochrome oxidase assembly protein CcoS [Sinimarinibacterium sp. CAU 1509]|nr:cbb3-type cytochrome oxidase assembly protein CcoS [Sinimarinibacterium sp. CAU 1509]TJY63003.1 cbb3-type cytochrome oxidase assembly protein CcoS [Sinimarinibacterium sp. CAU 1509]